MSDVGWHWWTGTHWSKDGGDEVLTWLAQRTAARIALEVDHLTATPREAGVIEDGEKATLELAELERGGPAR